MKLGSRRFAPRWWAALLYVAVALAMVGLGVWQLERAEEKIVLLERAARAREAPPVSLENIDDIESAARDYRRVVVSGRWEGNRQLLWDNRAHAGRAGYEVVTPLRLGDGRLALVDRGWVASGATRERASLPDVSLPSIATSAPVRLEGLLSRPSKGFASGDALTGGTEWPGLLQYFDYAAIESALGEPVVAAVVQPQVAADTGAFATATDAGGLVAGPAVGTDRGVDVPSGSPPALPAGTLLTPNWRPAASGPEKHYGYAFQWFAMALALTVLFVRANLSRAEDTGHLPAERDHP